MVLKRTNEMYDDIIHLEYKKSTKHKHMSMQDRAAQFSPFAALTGHEEAICETARLTNKKIELPEYEKNIINEKLNILTEYKGSDVCFEIIYFEKDKKKEGGKYIKYFGSIKDVDIIEACVVTKDYKKIPIADIMEITSEVINENAFL